MGAETEPQLPVLHGQHHSTSPSVSPFERDTTPNTLRIAAWLGSCLDRPRSVPTHNRQPVAVESPGRVLIQALRKQRIVTNAACLEADFVDDEDAVPVSAEPHLPTSAFRDR